MKSVFAFAGTALAACAAFAAEMEKSTPEAEGISSAAIGAWIDACERELDALHASRITIPEAHARRISRSSDLRAAVNHLQIIAVRLQIAGDVKASFADKLRLLRFAQIHAGVDDAVASGAVDRVLAPRADEGVAVFVVRNAGRLREALHDGDLQRIVEPDAVHEGVNEVVVPEHVAVV